MPSFGSGVYVEPGAYTQFKPTTEFPVIPGGLRVAAILGKGSNSINVVGEAVVTTATLDALAHTASSITNVVDSSFVTYTNAVDFTLSVGKVKWLTTAALVVGGVGITAVTGTVSITAGTNDQIILTIDESTTLSATITVGSRTAIQIATDINTLFSPSISCTVTVASGLAYIQITATGPNASILIGNGTVNGTLGLISGGIYYGALNPTLGTTIYVDYTYVKATADYTPTYYFSLTDIVNAFGSADPVNNTLALGAQIAIENGAQVILACQLDPADTSDLLAFRNALDKIKTVNCNIVCVMTGDTNLFPYVKAHVDQMSSLLERKERTAMLGLTGSITIAEIEAQAASLDDKRVMLIYPAAVRRVLDTGVDTAIGGFYLSSALAGIRCNPVYDVAEPLTRKEVVGFSQITDNLLRSQKNELASSGVCIVETDDAGTARVRHALTTDMSTAENQEFSITEIVDYTGQVTRQILEKIYVGSKILSETPVMVSATTRVVLQNLIEREIITDFSNLTASQNSLDPRQIDVRFAIKPVYPLNWVYISFSIATA